MERFAEGCSPHIQELVRARARRPPQAPPPAAPMHNMALNKPLIQHAPLGHSRPLSLASGPPMGSSSIPTSRSSLQVVGGVHIGGMGNAALPLAPMPNVRSFSPSLQQVSGGQQRGGMTLGGLGMPLGQAGSRPVGVQNLLEASRLPGGSQQPPWPLPQQPHLYHTPTVLPGGGLPYPGPPQHSLASSPWRPTSQ